MEHDKEGAVMFSEFMIEGQWLTAMDSGYDHGFSFNEGVSLMVSCKDQEEIDYYWEKLSFVPEAEQCGWLKDKYGISWQIVPSELGTLLKSSDQEEIDSVMRNVLTMKKIEIDRLKN